MANIHPTSIVEGDVKLADDVEIGPCCVVRGPVTIGAGSRVLGHSHLTGKLVIGKGNTIYPFCCLGFAGQDASYPNDMFEPGIVIGNGNTLREYSSVHRATRDLATTIGNDNFFMTSSHIAHDCIVGNNCTLVTQASLGGHVWVDDGVIIGGGAAVHQFVRIGRGVLVSGLGGVSQDIPPFFTVTGINIVASPNLVGMRRSGMDRDEITKRKDIFKLLYRDGGTKAQMLQRLRSAGDDISSEYADFIEATRKGVCLGTPDERRSERRNKGRLIDA